MSEHTVFTNHHADPILPGLYLGNRIAATRFPFKKGDVLISALTEEEYEDHNIMDICGVERHKFIIDDDPTENISVFFESVHAIIRASLKRGATVLVHCAGGIRRSPTLVAAHLILEYNWTADAALEFLGKRRMGIYPNSGFMLQLRTLENAIISAPPALPTSAQNIPRADRDDRDGYT